MKPQREESSKYFIGFLCNVVGALGFSYILFYLFCTKNHLKVILLKIFSNWMIYYSQIKLCAKNFLKLV